MTFSSYLLLLLAVLLVAAAWRFRFRQRVRRPQRRCGTAEPAPSWSRPRKKPEWVRREVIRLKAFSPDASCRTIAATFCALHLGTESVGKTFVANLLRDEKHRIEAARRDIRRRRPRVLPRNRLWALDLTGIPGSPSSRVALGILDHGTRACIALRVLESKRSIVLLRELAAAVARHGKPTAIRTDNEAVFTSRLFRVGLWVLGIRHQRIERLAPWQNGRIERFFGTFKRCWRLFRERSDAAVQDIQAELTTFRAWYNHVRTHQHLGGRVPADVWAGVQPEPGRTAEFVSEWEEVLTGFHFR